ncbi:sigma-70 family RNA polymerase sigma factor [Bacillus cereus group sp. RP32]|uniref:sigma-70 family RNA polymerase sigma factor n=1 Tax=Bacillus cereus group sp. RP32 TaxID=3040258 RepID=UPI003391D66D
MRDLIIQYKETLCRLENAKISAKEEEIKILTSMISDVTYALEWMKNAKMPGNRRGMERRAAYQREKSYDSLLMQRYFRSTDTTYEWDDENKESVISEWERIKLEDALSTLTKYEREIYIMSRGRGITQEKIAKYLNVSRSTIKTILYRSEIKIAKQVRKSLFCESS